MTRINTNVASLRGLRSLQSANKTLNQSLTRLSTGLQINSGRDNPAGLIASETLRSQITAIEQSIKNSNRANNVIATADSALGEIGGLLNQIRGLVQEGLNTGALSQAEIEANQLQIDAALNAIDRISGNTTFAGDKLIDGSKAFVTSLTAADAAELSDYQINEALFGSSSTIAVNATVDAAAERGTLQYSGGPLSAATTIEVSGADGSQVLFLGGSSTVANIRDAINAVTDVTGVTASITGNATAGTVTLDSTAANADVTFTDARATAEQAVFNNSVSVVFADPSTNNAALGLSVATNGGGATTITVNLATNGNGTITSNASQVAALINGNSQANAFVSATGEGDGSGTVEAIGATQLADGTNAELTLESENFGSRNFVDVNVLSGSFDTTLDDGITAASRDTGVDIAVTINGQQATTDGLKASVKTATLDASLTFASAANVANTETTVNVTGGGSLFQIGQEVSVAGQVGLGIEAINTARLGGASGKLYELGSGGGKSLLDVSPSVPGSDLVNILDEALTEVSTLRGRLGALQKNVIETNITTLGVALENLSESRSQIIDTDFAQETANLTRAQILSQSTLSSLAIANQNPSQVLSLLG